MPKLLHTNFSKQHFQSYIFCVATNSTELLLIKDEDEALENRQELNSFLANVEKRAFRMAVLATGNSDLAMDIVQDAMFALVKKYSHKKETEWGPLFYRIVQSKIRDNYRRTKTRNGIFSFLLSNDEDQADPIQKAEDTKTLNPEQNINTEQQIDATLAAISALPLRQQQTFLLRAWQGYDVKETALAMRCSQGSVKTHYSRAVHTLKDKLENIK